MAFTLSELEEEERQGALKPSPISLSDLEAEEAKPFTLSDLEAEEAAAPKPAPRPLITGPGQPIFTPKQVEAAPKPEVKKPAPLITRPGQPIFEGQPSQNVFQNVAEAARTSVADFAGAVTQLRAGQKRFDIETGKKELARMDKEREDALKKPEEERSSFENFLIEDKMGKEIQQRMLDDELSAKHLTAVAQELRKATPAGVRETIQESADFLSEGSVKEIAKRALKNPVKFTESLFTTAANQAGLMLSAALPGGQAALVAEETGRFEQDLLADAKRRGVEVNPEILAKYSTMFGIPSGLIETYTNRLLISPGKIPGVRALLNKTKGTVIGRLAAVAGVSSIGALSEGGEEWTQGKLEDVLGAHVYFEQAQGATDLAEKQKFLKLGQDKINQSKNIKKQRKEFIMGAMLGFFFGGAGTVREAVKAVQPTQELGEVEQAPAVEEQPITLSELEQEEADAGVTPEPTPTPLEEPSAQVEEAVEPTVEPEGALATEEEVTPEPVVEEVQPEVEVEPAIQEEVEETPKKEVRSFEEFEKLTDKVERRRIFEMNPVTKKPGTPAFERNFVESTEGETKSIAAGAGDVNGFKIYDDVLGEGPADALNAKIYDAAAEVLTEEELSNLHGDEYAIVAKKGETPAQVVEKIQQMSEKIAEIEVELGGKIFHPTMKWRVESPSTLTEFGEINPKPQKPNTIRFDKEGKGEYIDIEAAKVPEDQIVTRDKFIVGEKGEISLRKPQETPKAERQPAPKELGHKGKVSERGKMGVPQGKPRSQKKPEVKPVVKKPPPKEAPKKPAESEIVGLNKAEQDRIRQAIGKTPLTPAERKTFGESLSQAKAKNLSQDAVTIAKRVLDPRNKSPLPITDEEHAGMVLKAGQLMNDFNEVTKTISDLQDKGDVKGVRTETARRVQISEDLDVLTAGARSARRDVARALSIGRMMINMVKYDVASTTQQARTMKGRALTEKETKKFTDLSHAYANLEERFNKLTEENKVKQEKTDKRIAQEVANILAGKERKVKTKRFTKILDERANILKDLNKLGFRMKEISGLGIEGSYHVGRLATNYIREMAASIKGKIEMAEVVKKVREKLPDVTDQDIYQALNQKNPKVQAKAKSAAEKQVTRLKKQGKLITDIEKMGKGIFPEKKTRAAEEPEIVELKEKKAALVKEAAKAGVEAKKLQKVEETSRDLEEQLEKQFRHIPPGKEKRKESPEIQAARKKAKDIQTQIDLVDQISDIQEQLRTGEIKVPEKKVKREDIVKVKALRNELNELRKQVYESGVETRQLETAMQTINELQDQLANHYRALKAKEVIPAQAVTTARKQILGLRRQLFVEDALSDINEQLKTGEFKIREKPAPRRLTPNLERTEVLLARKRKELRQAINEMGPVTAGQVLNEIVGLPRALQSTGDMSGWLRQNIIPVLSHPVKAARLIPTTTKAFFSEYHADKVQQDLLNDPRFYLTEKSKLETRELDGKPFKREESFQSNLAEKIPILRHVVRASNRNMVTLGNLIRHTLFYDYLAKNPNSTHEELSAYAQILNVTTGIGNLGPLANAGNLLGILAYAPKLAVSRFQTPWYLYKSRKYPRVFKQAMRDIGGFVATGSVILGLFAMMADDDDDMEVSDNPRNPDFGKIRKGNTRFDIWGGYQQPARLILRIMLGAMDKTGLTGKFVPEEEEDINPMDLLWKFIQYKASPFISAGIQLYTGETVVGEKITPPEVAVRAFTMLTLQDIYETAKKEGPVMGTLAGGAAWVGIGVNTYGDSYERVLQIERRRSRLEKEDKKLGREFKKKHRKILTFTNRAKSLDTKVKELEKERDEAKEKGRDKLADRKQKQIDRRIQAFELSFDRRMR